MFITPELSVAILKSGDNLRAYVLYGFHVE